MRGERFTLKVRSYSLKSENNSSTFLLWYKKGLVRAEQGPKPESQRFAVSIGLRLKERFSEWCSHSSVSTEYDCPGVEATKLEVNVWPQLTSWGHGLDRHPAVLSLPIALFSEVYSTAPQYGNSSEWNNASRYACPERSVASSEYVGAPFLQVL